MTISTFTFIGMCILIIVLIYLTYNLFKKVEKLESIAENQDIYIVRFSSTIDDMNKRLKEIDEKGSFQSDDEIGWFFESLKTLQTELNDFNINRNFQ